MSMGETPETPATAITTPAIGDIDLNSPVESCRGKTKVTGGVSSSVARSVANVENVRNAALPLPESSTVIPLKATRAIDVTEENCGRDLTRLIRLSERPDAISPLEKMVAAMSRITTDLNIVSAPRQKCFMPVRSVESFLVRKSSTKRAKSKLKPTARRTSGVGIPGIRLQVTIRSKGINGNRPYAKGTVV